MPDQKQIPDELKWRLAAGFVVKMPALYDRAFRQTAGKRFDGLEQEIWMELARHVAMAARDIHLPARNAQEIARTLVTMLGIIYGPEYKSEALELNGDSAVIIVKRCPFLDEVPPAICTGECLFHKCLALALATVPLLNKDYAARYVRTMCTGDRQCEIKIAIDTGKDAR